MTTPILLAALVGGGVLFWPTIARALQRPLPSRSTDTFGPNPYAIPPPRLAPNPPGMGTRQPPMSQMGGAAASALGLSVAMATAIAAVGGFLAWGITQRGWFRGGEEALYVNPERDDFKAFFAHLNPYRTTDANGPGFYGLAWLLHELTRDDLMARFNRADTRPAFEAVVADIETTVATNAARVRGLVAYAQTNFPLSA